MIRRYLQLIILAATTLLLMLAFNNCSRYGSGSSSQSSSLQSGFDFSLNPELACSVDDIDVFNKGYHQLLMSKCSQCHTLGGQGKGSFADPDLKTAFAGFQLNGYDKISKNAVSELHNAPYTGLHNSAAISELREQWELYQKEKVNCEGSTSNTSSAIAKLDPNYTTTSQNITPLTSEIIERTINGTKTPIKVFNSVKLSWKINDSEIFQLKDIALPKLVNASISISVTGYITAAGETAYLFTMPTLTSGDQSVRIKGITLKLNGQPVRYTNTFEFIDESVYKNTTALLYSGSLLAVGHIGDNDNLSLQIGLIESVELPTPPPKPEVKFELTSYTVQKADLGKIFSFNVQVIGENPNAIVIPITVGTNTTALNTRFVNKFRDNRTENRFDWDYNFISNSSNISIPANIKSAKLDLWFSDDIRTEDQEKILSIDMGTPSNANLIVNAKSLQITIPNYAPKPSIDFDGVDKFSALMDYNRSTGEPYGVLAKNCWYCHNSVELQGFYDITNYAQLVSKSLIIPGSVVPNALDSSKVDYVTGQANGNLHTMFRRMNGDNSMNQGLNKMPKDNWLDQLERDAVQRWIINGALNN